MPPEVAIPCLILLCFALAFLPPGPKQDVRGRNNFRSWGSE